MKVCRRCREVKALELFNKNKSKENGLQDNCRQCQKAFNKAYRDNNADKARQYYLDNAEKMRLKAAAWYKSNTEKARETAKKYSELNKEKVRERSVIYRKNNKEKLGQIRINRKIDILLCARKYRENNHEKVLLATKVWREANPDNAKKWREALPDSYVITLLRVKNSPKELIELKRVQILITRELRNKKQCQI